MKRLVSILAFAALSLAVTAPDGSSLWSGVARAEIGTADAVPAATLLLPYFEVDLKDPTGPNTVFTINNASATAAIAHVMLWTDQSIPTLNFDVYLTGYDVQRIDLRRIFKGSKLPVTADAAADPSDAISPQGPLSQDINLPGASGPCDASTVYANPALRKAQRRHLRRAHRGLKSPTLGGCAGANYGDRIARGYVTVDSVAECTTLYPTDPGYFLGVADQRNVLWGEYEYLVDRENHSTAGPLVHVEACDGSSYMGSVGNGAGHCPFGAGDYTFYGRYVGFTGGDGREPLPGVFAARFLNGGAFDATDLVVWRDAKTTLGAAGPFGCGVGFASWFPLGQTQIDAFDEAENTVALAGATYFPLETQRVTTSSGSPFGEPLALPFTFGWLFLNLHHTIAGDPLPGVAQAWVGVEQKASGRFAMGFQAIALDSNAP